MHKSSEIASLNYFTPLSKIELESPLDYKIFDTLDDFYATYRFFLAK